MKAHYSRRCFVVCSFLTGLVASTVQAQPYAGTIFLDPDIITPSDPGSLVSVTYVGQDMKTVWDYRVPGWVEINAFLFDVVWNDGVTSLGVVNPEFGSQSAAAFQVDRYADALGRVPTCLRTGVDELWIHAGIASFGGGNSAIVIHTGRGEEYIADGILEEAFVHEGTHCSLDATHASAAGWLAAQAADPNFISTYAAGAPTTEDLAESYLPWLAVRYRASRITTSDYNTILSTIPQRLDYLDGITCDLYPITSGLGMEDTSPNTSTVAVFPSPANDRLTLRTTVPLPADTRFVIHATDGRLMYRSVLSSGTMIDIEALPPGLYLWRCESSAQTLAGGRIAIE